MSGHTAENDALDYTPNADTLSEHVIDRHGLVWRVVRDGGMATRAHYAGIVSIGIHALEREHGPLRTVEAGSAIPPGKQRPTPRCHCGAYPVSPDHCLTLFDRDDTAVERHAVGGCERGEG